jgi:hypothetical protein
MLTIINTLLWQYFYMCICYADILLEKGQIKAEEIWDIYKSAPRVAQVYHKLSGGCCPILSARL